MAVFRMSLVVALLIAVALCAEPIAARRVRYNSRKEDYKCKNVLTRKFVRDQTPLDITADGCTQLSNKEVRCVYRFETYGNSNFILDLKCKRGGWSLRRGNIPTETNQ